MISIKNNLSTFFIALNISLQSIIDPHNMDNTNNVPNNNVCTNRFPGNNKA